MKILNNKPDNDPRHLSQFDDYDRTKINANHLDNKNDKYHFDTPKEIFLKSLGMGFVIYLSVGFGFTFLVSQILSHLTKTAGLFMLFFHWFIDPFPVWIAKLWNGFGVPLWMFVARIALYAIFSGCWGYYLYSTNRKNRSLHDHSDMEYEEGDMRLVQPEELPDKFNIFPDAGAHSHQILPSMILAHMMLDEGKSPQYTVEHRQIVYETENTGSRRSAKIKRDQNGNPVYHIYRKSKPMIDNAFGDKLFDSMEISDRWRQRYQPKKLTYNPKMGNGKYKYFDKPKYTTVYDMMKADWYMPDYENQTPGGMYIVSTGPENSLVVAETRAGKGQTIINPLIDMWSRTDNKANIMANDPKGELISQFYYPLVKRGFNVVQFNLMFPEKTNIYNPLLYAAEASRQGNIVEMSAYVDEIAELLFPSSKNSDQFWVKAPRNVFKELAIGMIAYYQDQEDQLRERAIKDNMSETELEHKLDVLWGHVTLNNLYQMMNVLSARKATDPELLDLGDNEPLEETNYLTLFFKAMAKLPRNDIRTQAINANDSVNSMAQSEKTLSSVYGVATTSLQFFSEMTVARLTSGRPSQNFDMASLSFPRRINVRFDTRFLDQHKLQNCQFNVSCYSNPDFAEEHRYTEKGYDVKGTVDPNGWVKAFFKPIFPENEIYIKLDLLAMGRGNYPAQTFYFKFTKHYQHALNGHEFVEEPTTGQRIIHGGSLDEYDNEWHKAPMSKKKVLSQKFKRSMFTLDQVNLRDNVIDASEYIEKVKAPCITQFDIGYEEKPKAIFMITPPNKSSYSQIILIALSQSFNTQYSNATTSQSDQKPFYNTFYMLDEIGNLTSDGKGIPGFTTKVSIGLGEGQRFIQIYQSLEQLTDVYGQSADKILEANMANITYLKSPNTKMIEELSKMSGEQHRVKHVGTTVDEDKGHRHKMTAATEGMAHENFRQEKQPVITVSQFLNIPKANAITLGRKNPIWATNQTALPYAYALHADQLRDDVGMEKGAHSYAANLVPTTSYTTEFNLIANTPDFFQMVRDVVKQAREADDVRRVYQERSGMNEEEMQSHRSNNMADNMMREIHRRVHLQEETKEARKKADTARYINTVKAECQGDMLSDDDRKLQGLHLSNNAMITDNDDDLDIDTYLEQQVLAAAGVLHIAEFDENSMDKLGYTEEEKEAYRRMQHSQQSEGKVDKDVVEERVESQKQDNGHDIFMTLEGDNSDTDRASAYLLLQDDHTSSALNSDDDIIDALLRNSHDDLKQTSDSKVVMARTRKLEYHCTGTTALDELSAGTVLIDCDKQDNNDDRPSSLFKATDKLAAYLTGCYQKFADLGEFASDFQIDYNNQV